MVSVRLSLGGQMTLKNRKIVGGIALALSKLLFVLPLFAFPIITAYVTAIVS